MDNRTAGVFGFVIAAAGGAVKWADFRAGRASFVLGRGVSSSPVFMVLCREMFCCDESSIVGRIVRKYPPRLHAPLWLARLPMPGLFCNGRVATMQTRAVVLTSRRPFFVWGVCWRN